ncbi:undecaprenyldiphospho-muramoylpentapeptide beta-N-acetylglucosaminyltransferase [Thiomicrorhabdus sp. zzn3]|uniref:undecaprenyldiphospho-muramoylpentapeptide beta-N-acetylglucosaminyltransferase n=1 Tax=Thiomicrorhabdus sp. zzn3 TaxID=3039775 RepID=UPI002436EA5E|nr:undecaprenyldiphospho-muramoylpentapeptide beta-N-acetylglucosaminyltransferase [Thiomicrorhabdus sp. zzn3]MDG6778502.1 undecaprenyldiphospho-muramoylpentapeptide beta-N-acetylglucosaminyltransferase [Thiomicrorhabdus sp. zzn3]
MQQASLQNMSQQASQKPLKVVIMAGGTGGHVFPGIAIAHALQDQGVDVSWLGTAGGMEADWVEKAGLAFNAISIKGLRGNGLLGWFKAPFNVTRAWWQAFKILRGQRPNLVLGMGGFVCGPGGLAAKSLGITLVIHEQNAIPGMTNKWLAPLATKVITAFPQQVWSDAKVETLGNPVRSGLETLDVITANENEASQPCRLLVLGGSRGALALNETLPKALALMPPEIRPDVWHQTGVKTLETAQQAYSQQAGLEQSRIRVVPFIEDMQQAYGWADMLLCRSGALTVSELMATARPAIMVPYPHAVDDHQTANAQALVVLQGGEVIQQSELTPERLSEALIAWCSDSHRRAEASRKIRAGAPKQATEKIVALLLKLMR